MAQKIIWIIFLIIGISIIGCDKGEIDEKYFESFEYLNNSGYNIHIKSYYMQASLKESNYEINNGTKIILKQMITIGQVDSLIINADSIRITFDNNKSVIYHKNDMSDYNIINRQNYISNKVSDNETNFKYEFTIEDYNQAN